MIRRSHLLVFALALGIAGEASAQTVTTGAGTSSHTMSTIQTPPSVDNGVANGSVKHAGSPSVSNGVANGVMKQAGSPSVGDGVANGVVKSSTINQ